MSENGKNIYSIVDYVDPRMSRIYKLYLSEILSLGCL